MKIIIRVSGYPALLTTLKPTTTAKQLRGSRRRRGTLLLLRQKKVPKEKGDPQRVETRPSHATQGAAGTCGALPSRRCGQPTA
jgi:hypothetical protein